MQALEEFVRALPAPFQRVTADSRLVERGSLFVAVPGVSLDGHDYIPQAIAAGALAVVGEYPLEPLPVPYLAVPDARQAVAYLSARQQGFPARRLTMIGVTGTDGKTTTVNLLYQILVAAGLRSGMISTVGAVLGGRETETGLHVTTPDAPAVQKYLTEMVQAGLTHAIVETTSHGLAQHRVSSCDFDVAVVTNITHEHLDYHGGYEAYRSAKAMLFEGLEGAAPKPGQAKAAVLNADDSSYAYLHTIPAERQIVYSVSGDLPAGGLTARHIVSGTDGNRFELISDRGVVPIHTNLIGRYNVSNVLAAAGAALALDIPLSAIQRGVANLSGISGRMERIDPPANSLPFTFLVDFAHTPNALLKVIETGRQVIAAGARVITVFGSAGLRDVAKRRMMAETSARQADLTVLTAEDPRTEALEAILADMAAGCVAQGGVEGETFFLVPDRLRAIHFALTLARPGDIVLLCGKGHEQSMCFGSTEYPWDDRVAARKALTAFLTGRELPGSGLPTESSG